MGANIAKLRKERGLTQVALAFECDFEKTNLRRIEAGLTNPTTKTLFKISKALNLELKELFEF